jgi:membrane protein YdbS with pleckstrin-like domain
MSPLAKHPILQHLPFELLQNPDRDGIILFLKKKVKTFYRIKIGMIIAFIVSVVLYFIFKDVHSSEKGLAILDNYADVLPLILFPILAFSFHKLGKQYSLTESEIDTEIGKFKSQQQVPA